MESSFGEKLKVTVSGGSHEPSVNVSVTGLPVGFHFDMDALQAFMDRRAPGKSNLASSRKEADVPFLKYDSASDSFAGPRRMDFQIANNGHRTSDYESFRDVPRPGHADYTARLRYGADFNMSGGGPFSGRMTAPLCVAGGLALQVLAARGISVSARLASAGESSGDLQDIEAAIAAARDAGNSIGGIVECTAEGLPAGMGGAMFEGIESRLSPILFGIPAVKGVEFGAGFRAARMFGSQNNDPYFMAESEASASAEFRKGTLPALSTRTNNCGGILGGITTGMPVTCRVAFKPTPSISIPQESVNLKTCEAVTISVTGRHDPCVALRAVPVVEAAVALGLLDAIMVTEDSISSAQIQNADDPVRALRESIDAIDSEILDLFHKRMQIAGEIGCAKKASGLNVTDSSRELEILDRIDSMSDPVLAPYARSLFKEMFSLSKRLQNSRNMQHCDGLFGIVGNPLGHSFSPQIHRAFGAYDYELFDMTAEEMTSFVSSRKYRGLSVTKPFKQDVIPLCDRLTHRAKAIGAVNTLYFEGDELVGHNTDYDGFLYAASRRGIDFAGKSVLVLGTGGTSRTVDYSVRDRGAARVYFASRNPAPGARDVYAYENLGEISQRIEIIVNTTPVGMYPGNLKRLVSLKDFPSCEAVFDVTYNPARTPLLMEAEDLGLKWTDGLPMLVAQAAAAAELFTGNATADHLPQQNGMFMSRIREITELIASGARNIILIGMPGCGKSTAGRLISDLTGRSFVDTDDEIVRRENRSIAEIFKSKGESGFRELESAVSREFGALHGQVIATGGGIVLSDDNYSALRQNGLIIWLTRPVDELPLEGRPLSLDPKSLEKLYDKRKDKYKKWADCTIDSTTLLRLLTYKA